MTQQSDSVTYDEERVARQRERDAEYDRLNQERVGKLCLNCDTQPRVATVDDWYKLVCNCPEGQEPVLIAAQTPESKALQRIVEQALAHPDPQVSSLTIGSVKAFFCPDATDVEADLFVRMCQATGLNPFLKDAFLTKRDKNKPAEPMIAAQAYRKWATHNPEYREMRSGIIVRTAEGKREEREGVFCEIGEELLGGWARVYKNDGSEPRYWSVPIQSYLVTRKAYENESPEVIETTWAIHPAPQVLKDAMIKLRKMPQSTWANIAPNMICKVAEKQDLERTFPEDISMWLRRAKQFGDVKVADEDVIEGEVISVSDRQPDARQRSKEELFGPNNGGGNPGNGGNRPANGGQQPPRQTIPDVPPAEMRDVSAIQSVGDLFNSCLDDFKVGRNDVLRILGITDPALITNLSDAYYQVKEAKGA